MGWKRVKEYYRIGHIVHIRKEGICIGSPYISEIIVIGVDGAFKKRYNDDGSNADLRRYQAEMDADPALLKKLIAEPDTFAQPVTVYTYDGGKIIEKQCETPGWPNVTHDGELMYENTFSTDRAKVFAWAKRNAEAGIKIWGDNLKEAQKRVAICEAELVQATQDLAQLQSA